MDCAARAHDLKVEHSATGLSFQHRDAKNTECKGSPGVIARSCLKKKKKKSTSIYLECFKNTLYKHSPSCVVLLPRTRAHLTVPELVLLLEPQPGVSGGGEDLTCVSATLLTGGTFKQQV